MVNKGKFYQIQQSRYFHKRKLEALLLCYIELTFCHMLISSDTQ